MKFLYKFFIRNEQEIRNDSPARVSYVAADNMSDAVLGYIDLNSLVQSVEFVSPITVVPSKKKSSDDISDSQFLYYNVIYRDSDDQLRTAFVRTDDTCSADFVLERLADYLSYTPIIVQISYFDVVLF